jgi:hypothetical protein
MALQVNLFPAFAKDFPLGDPSGIEKNDQNFQKRTMVFCEIMMYNTIAIYETRWHRQRSTGGEAGQF